MAFPTHYAQARILMRSPQNSTGINILWFQPSAPPADPAADALTLAEDIDDAVNGLVKACLTTNSSYQGTVVTVNSTGGAFTQFVNTNAGVGIVGGDELPSYAAAVIQKRTSTAGKEGRGRWYVPFVPETMTDEGLLTEAAEESYQLLGEAYKTNYTIGGVTYECSHWSGKLEVMLLITSVNAQAILGTQRRRRLRGNY